MNMAIYLQIMYLWELKCVLDFFNCDIRNQTKSNSTQISCNSYCLS